MKKQITEHDFYSFIKAFHKAIEEGYAPVWDGDEAPMQIAFVYTCVMHKKDDYSIYNPENVVVKVNDMVIVGFDDSDATISVKEEIKEEQIDWVEQIEKESVDKSLEPVKVEEQVESVVESVQEEKPVVKSPAKPKQTRVKRG